MRVRRADHHRQMKLPMVAGIDGTRKNQTMMMPWIVNGDYSSEVRNSRSG